MTAFVQGRMRYDATQSLTRLQERADNAFSTLEPELQLAGYFGVPGASLLPQPIDPNKPKAAAPEGLRH